MKNKIKGKLTPIQKTYFQIFFTLFLYDKSKISFVASSATIHQLITAPNPNSDFLFPTI
jgi:hypothetical protein